MEEVRCMESNNNWIWIILAVLLLSGSFGGDSSCGTGFGVGGNFFDQLKCGDNSWIMILGLLFIFNKVF